MITLRRTVRFSINPADDPDAPVVGENGFGGKPAMTGLGRYYEVTLTVSGTPDPRTGYLISIKDIDRIAREHIVPLIARCCRDAPETEPVQLLPRMVEAARHSLPILTALHWQLTPTLQVETAGKHMTSAIIRQRFDFAAAHRLHAPSLSDDENRATFGRCNNPSGHGHNYRIETAFLTSPASSPPLSAAELESLVDRVLVDPFDHKHLNEDTEEFSTANGYNPSVENIARVFYDRLAPVAASELAGRASLHEVTVWETDRTCATYPSVQDR